MLSTIVCSLQRITPQGEGEDYSILPVFNEETHNTTPHYAILLYTAKGNGARGERED